MAERGSGLIFVNHNRPLTDQGSSKPTCDLGVSSHHYRIQSLIQSMEKLELEQKSLNSQRRNEGSLDSLPRTS